MKTSTKIAFEANTKIRIAYYIGREQYNSRLYYNGELLDDRLSENRAEAESAVVAMLKELGVVDSDILETVALLIEYDGNSKIVKGVDSPATTLSFFLY